MKKIVLFVVIIAFATTITNAQKIKFGSISKEELEEKTYPLDSTADAAFLYKEKRIHYEFNSSQGWSIITEVHEKLKVYTKKGFDYAQKRVNLFESGGSDEKMYSIKAYTYNLIDGKKEKVKLDKKQIFTEEVTKNRTLKKFTMPDLKVGSVVEWKYTTSSPFITYLDKLILQNNIPIKKLLNAVRVPEYFVFKKHSTGYLPINLKQTKKNRIELDLVENVYTIDSKDIPALKPEPFVSNINNYRSGLELELSYIKFPNSAAKNYATTWEDVSKKIHLSPSFGTELDKSSYYKSQFEALGLTGKSENEKIITLLQFVKNKVKWNNHNSIYTEKGVKKAFKEGTGNVTDINLMLVSLLRKAGLSANPVLLSTRNHGIALYPTLKGFNYVIAAVKGANGDYILLDASEKYSSPNTLPLRTINWEGRMVTKDGRSMSIPLTPKTYALEKNMISVKFDEEFNAQGMLNSTSTGLNALIYRNKYNHLKEEDHILKLEDKYNFEIDNFRVSNKANTLKPITHSIQFTSDNYVEKINGKIYINPFGFTKTATNPFKLEERKFPIDYGTPWKTVYKISINIPEGYKIESLPKSMGVGISDNVGLYKYQIIQNQNTVNIITTHQFNMGIIVPNYYSELKELYKQIVAKKTEKIVLVKA